jgi:hypothetical protein
MSFFADSNLRAKLLKDIQDLYTKRTKLEAHIRQLDALTLYRIEKAAVQEIDVYRARLSHPQLSLFERTEAHGQASASRLLPAHLDKITGDLNLSVEKA